MVPEAEAVRAGPRWRALLPYALALVLVAYVLARADWRALTAALAGADHLGFAAFALAFVLALLTADAFAMRWIYARSGAALSFGTVWMIRAASYLPSLLNHHVGQAWLTWAIARASGTSLARVTGATLLVYVSWAGCLLLLAGVAIAASGLDPAWLAIPLVAGAGYLALLAVAPRRLVAVRWLAPLFEAGIGGHFEAMARRLPHMVVLFFGTWLPFRFFDVAIPTAAALTHVPLLMVAVTLPLTPQGVGTRDVLAVELFARHAPGATAAEQAAAVAAATASTAVLLTLIEALIGLALVRRASRAMAGEA